MKAVLFGAGDIGRGIVGMMLHEGGYDLVFSDASTTLVDAINAESRYAVRELGADGSEKEVTGFRALNSAQDPQAVIDEVSGANIITATVEPSARRLIAPLILAGLALRNPASPPLQVMACENAIDATDRLRDAIREHAGEAWDAFSARVVFARTVLEATIIGPHEGAGIDVTVAPFPRWSVERDPFGGSSPRIPGARFVDILDP